MLKSETIKTACCRPVAEVLPFATNQSESIPMVSGPKPNPMRPENIIQIETENALVLSEASV